MALHRTSDAAIFAENIDHGAVKDAHTRIRVCMGVEDFSCALYPVTARSGIDQTGRVHVLGEVGDGLGVELSPGLIERYPYDDGLILFKLRNYFGPLLIVILHIVLITGPIVASCTIAVLVLSPLAAFIVASDARHILPNHHTEAVAGIIPMRRFYLDMFAYHIEAQFFSSFNIPNEGFRRRSSIKSIRPPALIQRSELEKNIVVQCESLDAFSVFHLGNLAHCRISLNLVDDFSVADQCYFKAVEIWFFRAPELRTANLHGSGFACGNGSAALAEYAPARFFGIVTDFRAKHVHADLVTGDCAFT